MCIPVGTRFHSLASDVKGCSKSLKVCLGFMKVHDAFTGHTSPISKKISHTRATLDFVKIGEIPEKIQKALKSSKKSLFRRTLGIISAASFTLTQGYLKPVAYFSEGGGGVGTISKSVKTLSDSCEVVENFFQRKWKAVAQKIADLVLDVIALIKPLWKNSLTCSIVYLFSAILGFAREWQKTVD